ALAVPVALLAIAAAAFRSLPGLAVAVLAAVSFRLLAGGAGSLSPAFAPASPPTPPPASFASRRALIGGKPARASVGHLGRGRCLGVPLRSLGGGLRRCTRRLRCLRLLGSERLFSGGMSGRGLVELFLIVGIRIALG